MITTGLDTALGLRTAPVSRGRTVACPLATALLCAGLSCTAAPRGDAAWQAADLAVFEREFLAVDRSYSAEARTRAEAAIAGLRQHPGAISNVQFVLELAKVVALADNGHTAMVSLGTLPEMARVGVRFSVFGTDFFVVRAVPDHADLLGGRLTAIDGVNAERLREAAHTLRGGIPSWRDRFVASFVESPGQLYALNLARSPAHATYRLQLPSGALREVSLEQQPNSRGGQPVMMLDPADAGSGWRKLLSVDRAPWSLQEFSTPFRRRDAPDLDAIVIQLHANNDMQGESIAAFLTDAEAARASAHRKNVVLDMRFNGGGNLQLTRGFMASLPDRLPPGGRVVVLTSPWTFSAAISSIGYLKQAGGDRVVLVGEAPGDRLQFWAEGLPFRLPSSGAFVQPATARHDYLDGCRQFADCHAYVRRFPISVKSLAPDIAAPWTIESYAAGRDPGMEAAARVLAPR
ncbi:MAG TPA: hypothetical protein VGY48_02625 [Vicinamibacterales bacterium]|jgi:hypothetical protein|nr:hypothetical protein [Vicinamibacterales bacterium]